MSNEPDILYDLECINNYASSYQRQVGQRAIAEITRLRNNNEQLNRRNRELLLDASLLARTQQSHWPQWIPVAERRPTREDNHDDKVLKWNPKKDFWLGTGEVFNEETHWLPLPPPPVVKSQEQQDEEAFVSYVGKCHEYSQRATFMAGLQAERARAKGTP